MISIFSTIFSAAFSTKSYNTNRYHQYPSNCDNNDSFLSLVSSSYSSLSLINQVQQQQQHQHQRIRYNTMTLHLGLSSAITDIPIMSDLVSTYGYCLKHHYFPTQSMTNAVLTMVGDGFAQSKENSDNMQEQQQQSSSTTATTAIIQYNYNPKRGMIYFFKGLGSGILWAWWFEQADVLSRELTQSTLSHIHGLFDTTTTLLLSSSLSQFQQQQEILDFTTTMTTTTTVVAAATAIVTSTTTLLAQQTEKIIQTTINILMEQFLVCPILFTVWDIPVTAMMQGDTKASQIPEQIESKLVPLLIANAKVYTFANIITYNIPLQYRLLSASAFSIISETINSGITSSSQVQIPQTSQTQIVNNKTRKLQERITPATVLVPVKSYSKMKLPIMTNSTLAIS